MDAQTSRLVHCLAGKSDPSGGGGWLPLWMHARDTAGILVRLAQSWLPEAVRRTLGMEEETLYKLACFLGMTHDIGKASAAFGKSPSLWISTPVSRLASGRLGFMAVSRERIS